MSGDIFTISFPGVSLAQGNQFAGTLAEALRDTDASVGVERRKERSDTQDFGSTLAVILGTAAVTAVAKGIGAWLARNSGARIEIRRHNKVVLIATHLDSKDVPRIAAAISQ